jgi:hypothetical protein
MRLLVAYFDLLKGIAWPLAVIIIAVVFKNDIRAILPRMRKAGPAGIELDPAEQQRAASTAVATSTPPGELRALPGYIRSEPIAAIERSLHAALQQVPEGDRIDVLVRELAQARLERVFERIYNLIFGSQILGLRRLNERPSVTIDEARAFFEEFRQANPDAYGSIGFEEWLGFLLNQGLVTRDGSSIAITDLGRDFLFYLAANRLPEGKPL